MLIFVTGGVRSGKSSFAEKLALSSVRPKQQLHYVATSVAYDEEMLNRVRRHQNDRANTPFITHEQPRELATIFDRFQPDDVVLIDCLTTLLSNELFADENNWKESGFRKQIKSKLVDVFSMFQQAPLTTILVSNEVTYSPLPKDAGSFYYLQLLGTIHQHIVAMCDQAILVEFGIPIYKKGRNVQ